MWRREVFVGNRLLAFVAFYTLHPTPYPRPSFTISLSAS